MVFGIVEGIENLVHKWVRTLQRAWRDNVAIPVVSFFEDIVLQYSIKTTNGVFDIAALLSLLLGMAGLVTLMGGGLFLIGKIRESLA